VSAAYQQAKDITLRRMYLDAMQSVLSHAKALVVDDKLRGLVPFLPLSVPEAGATPPPAGPPSTNPLAGGPAR
jgi:membrane protease subunit HflK